MNAKTQQANSTYSIGHSELAVRVLALENLSAQHQAEIGQLNESVVKLISKMTVLTERLSALSDDYHAADELREQLQQEVAKVNGGIKVLIWLVSIVSALDVLVRLLH